MKLKKYNTLLLQVGILLFITAFFFFMLEQQKKFITIDFSKYYAKNKTIELSGFEEGEPWRGNYSYDSQRVMEGKTSITLSSWYGMKNSIVWKKNMKVPTEYSKGYISLFIPDKKNLNAITLFQLSLKGEGNEKKEYNLTPLLNEGWNRLPVIIPQWGKISEITIALSSKKGLIAEVNLDRLWIENTSIYTADMFHTTSPSLSLRTIGERTYLYSVSPVAEPYSLSTPPSIKRGSMSIALIPEHAGAVELSLGTSSMRIDGQAMNTCTVFQSEGKTHTKILASTSGKDNLYVFLKGSFSGKKIVFSVSNNGIDYETCGEGEGVGGQIKLTLKGSYLIDSYSAEY